MMVNLGAAVNVIHGIRTHHAQTTGCPTWDEAGIRAALTGCEGSPGSVLAAAALAAEDTNLRAPSVAAFRRIAQARWGDAGPGACRPIGSWKGTDVFAYLAKHDLPVHPAYAMSFGGRLDRIWLRVSPIGSITNSHKGRADWEAHYYRDVMDGKSTGDDT